MANTDDDDNKQDQNERDCCQDYRDQRGKHQPSAPFIDALKQ